MAGTSKVWRNIGIAAAIIIVFLAIAKSAGWMGSSDAVKVSVDKVSVQNITETVSANGKVQPEVEVKISAEAAPSRPSPRATVIRSNPSAPNNAVSRTHAKLE